MTSDTDSRYRNYDRFYRRGDQEEANTTGLYRRYAKNYARQFSSLLPGDRDCTICDLGCANGMLLWFLSSSGYNNLTGVDLNAELIGQARENVLAEFIVGDAVEFLRSGRRFDLIFLLNILEHIDRDRLGDFTTALAGAINPGGCAIVRTPNMSNIMAAGHLADDFTHCTGLTEQSLTQLAQAAGFAEVTMCNQFAMQNIKGKLKAVCNYLIHKPLWSLRGGTKPRVFYRNLYAVLSR